MRLIAHPGGIGPAVRSLETGLVLTEPEGLLLEYRLIAAIRRLRVPLPVSPRRVDGLWQHTCFEAFVRRAGEDAYREFNFSPSGAWAAYAFRRYREGGANLAGDFNCSIQVRKDAGRLELSAVIPHALLPPGPADVPLRVGLSAVIEDRDGSLSYWALRHPPGRPDFHHPDAFALEIRREN